MATICKQLELDASADAVWDALRDFGAVHARVAPGFVTATQLDGDTRVVTFGNGTSARERLISSDDATRRLVYSVVGGRFEHDNTAVQVFADGAARCRLIWQRDMLPDALAAPIAEMMDLALQKMKPALERGAGIGHP